MNAAGPGDSLWPLLLAAVTFPVEEQTSCPKGLHEMFLVQITDIPGLTPMPARGTREHGSLDENISLGTSADKVIS